MLSINNLFNEYKPLLEPAQGYVSFWGVRKISYANQPETYTLSSVIRDLNDKLQALFLKNNLPVFDKEESKEAFDLLQCIFTYIDRLNQEADQCIEKANLFTRILALFNRIIFGKPQLALDLNDLFPKDREQEAIVCSEQKSEATDEISCVTPERKKEDPEQLIAKVFGTVYSPLLLRFYLSLILRVKSS